jgi:3-methyladenine DNA glycosylase Mpg
MIATIVKAPHLLYTGANGTKTYAITVRATGPEAEVEKAGRRREWDINDFTVLSRPDRVGEALGLSPAETDALYHQMKALVDGQL